MDGLAELWKGFNKEEQDIINEHIKEIRSMDTRMYLDILEAEIAWCRKNLDICENTNTYSAGFVKGLEQASAMVRAARTLIIYEE